MRDAMADLGGDPARVNPLVPADLVIDHSVQVDRFGTPAAFAFNVEREYERNGERYQLLRWAQTAFRDLRVVPPGTGIVHQVNLEFLATVVTDAGPRRRSVAYPDTLVGTDSHTTMINALGVLGYGVGGIEAEAVLLGQPLYQPMPRDRRRPPPGELPHGSTATDLVLVVTEMLRGHGVVGAFVEFAGDGLAGLSLADRATISNMSPEFGATATIFPIDDETLAYLRLTGRPPERVDLVERYAKEQGLWREPGAGPDVRRGPRRSTSRPSSRPWPARAGRRTACRSTALRDNFRTQLPDGLALDGPAVEARRRRRSTRRPAESFPAVGSAVVRGGRRTRRSRRRPHATRRRPAAGAAAATAATARSTIEVDGERATIQTGSVAIAAITSCTNTSNPTVMVGAGLLARNAVARGPARRADRQDVARPGLEGRHRLPRGGRPDGAARARSGSRSPATAARPASATPARSTRRSPQAIEANDLVVAAVLSGNRNFEGRIHPLARASYLASPPLVVAFALAGRVDIDLTTEPARHRRATARPVYLVRHLAVARRDPARSSARRSIRSCSGGRTRSCSRATSAGGPCPIPHGDRYDWDPASTYIAKPPFFDGPVVRRRRRSRDIVGARVLAVLGDSVTTDHISPAGSISPSSPAGQWLQDARRRARSSSTRTAPGAATTR